MKIAYEKWAPGPAAIDVIIKARRVCESYAAQGYDLTLRQLYYQFVARGWLPNTTQSYKRLGSIIDRARMAGLLDWDYIVDRTRNLARNGHWDNPASIIDSARYGYAIDKWAGQDMRVEVWVEKEALAGVIGQVAFDEDVAWFACRGYVSQSEMWAAGQRLAQYMRNGQDVLILHLGDHDPSGVDMTRDIIDRLATFTESASSGRDLEVRRIALTIEQIEQYQPPPNPAKLTDSRSAGYINEHGDQSWELDALDPAVLGDLIREHIEGVRDPELYERRVEREATDRELLTMVSDRWAEVVNYLGGSR